MMLKFLLFFCFATLHVLGEQGSFKNNNPLISVPVTSEQIASIQHSEKSFPSNKVENPIENLPAPLDEDENKTKSEQSSSITESQTNNSDHSTTVSEPISVSPSTTVSSTEGLLDPSKTTKTTQKTIPTIPTIPTTTTTTNITNTINTTTTPDILSITPSTPVSWSSSPGKWMVNDANKTCIVVQMSVMFKVSYDYNHTTTSKEFEMPVDNTTTKASGSCGTLEQKLTLQWSAKNITNSSMTLHFVKNETDSHYSLHHLEVVLPPTDFPNGTFNQSLILMHEEPSFVVGLNNSYRCLEQQKLNIKGNDTNKITGYLTISSLQFQAFKEDNSTLFGLAKDCTFDTPDVVAIAVGCALAGLVIIVLIAYLFGRRRNQARGYLSM